MSRKKVKFPKTFLWGAASGAHQIEGKNHNQWSAWEQENATVLAAKASQQFQDLENWPVFEKIATSPMNYMAGEAVCHRQNVKNDFDLMQEMNLNCFKFSIEWSRIEPEEGVFEASELNYYKKYVVALRARKIEPIVTLFHFTLPKWFADKGGFEKRSNVQNFVNFVDKISAELGPTVKFYITLHQPTKYAERSYLTEDWPPQKESKSLYRKVLTNLAYAHRQAAAVIKNNQARAKVSVAHYTNYVYPGDNSKLSVNYAAFLQWQKDDHFLSKIIKKCDFLGVEYFESSRVYGYRVHNPEHDLSDVGDPITPEDLEYAVERLWKKYKLPILITGTGLADYQDLNRQKWLLANYQSMQNLLNEKVKLIGYLYSNLLDSYEFDWGKWARFGLVAVNYRNFDRKIKPSGRLYAKIIKDSTKEK